MDLFLCVIRGKKKKKTVKISIQYKGLGTELIKRFLGLVAQRM